MYAAGKIPGSFFKREGRAGEKAHPDRAHDRPPDPAALPEGLALRDAARRDADVGRPRPPLRHPRDERRLRRAGDLRRSRSPTPRRRGADRQARRQLRRQPRRGGPRGARARPDRRRHRRGDPDGRGRRQRASPRPRSSTRSTSPTPRSRSSSRAMEELREKAGKEKIEVEAPEVDEAPARADPAPRTARSSTRRRRSRTSSSARTRSRRSRRRCSRSTRRRPATSEADPRAARRGPARVRQAREGHHPQADRRRQEAPRRPRRRTRSAPIEIEVGVAPRTHGSALFTRGETQVLSSVALGTTRDGHAARHLGLETTKRFWHHYNFPPFSVGEAGFMRGPKRRDIGHGALAERALVPTIPTPEDFPYTIRVVSDILESNGSSSMALGLRLVAGADGRGRADQARRSPASRWA